MGKTLILLTFCCVLGLQAQKVEDKSKLVVEYKMTKMIDTIQKETFDDDLTLLIGNKGSLYYSSKWIYLSNKFKELADRMIQDCVVGATVETKGTRTLIYNNYTTAAYQVVEPIKLKNYSYELKGDLLSWKMLKGSKKILGYNCQKAEARHRGRLWTAWFTAAIPLQEGPWFFRGLPGLVLEVTDSQNHFKFEAQAVKKEALPITFSVDKTIKTTKAEIEKIYADEYLIFQKKGLNSLVGFRRMGSGAVERMRNFSCINPIERPAKVVKAKKRK